MSTLNTFVIWKVNLHEINGYHYLLATGMKCSEIFRNISGIKLRNPVNDKLLHMTLLQTEAAVALEDQNRLVFEKFHYENKPIQIYWKFYHQKNENFRIKIPIFVFIFLLKT